MRGEAATKFLRTEPPGAAALPPAFLLLRSDPAALLQALPASRSAPAVPGIRRALQDSGCWDPAYNCVSAGTACAALLSRSQQTL